MRRSASLAADEGTPARSVVAAHLLPIAEVVTFLAAILSLGAFLDIPDRFGGVAPHPFWIIVILAAARYGTGAGLTAAALASGALLAGNVPEQAFDETLADWLLRTTKLPVIWFLTATVLGEIRSGHVRAHEELIERFDTLRDRADRIAGAYEELSQAKSHLELRIAGQKQTLRAAYEASGSIERDSVASVLDGALPFVKSIIGPRKASLFVLVDDRLQVLSHDRWSEADGLAASFDATSPLFEAIVARRDHLSVAVAAEESVLGGQGLMAGPLLDKESGRVFGMLKIEDTGLWGLSASSAIEFRIVCVWIGRACGNACRALEHARASPRQDGARKDGTAPGVAILEPVRNDNRQQAFPAAGSSASVAGILARLRAKRRQQQGVSAERKRAGAAARVALVLREEAEERDRAIN